MNFYIEDLGFNALSELTNRLIVCPLNHCSIDDHHQLCKLWGLETVLQYNPRSFCRIFSKWLTDGMDSVSNLVFTQVKSLFPFLKKSLWKLTYDMMTSNAVFKTTDPAPIAGREDWYIHASSVKGLRYLPHYTWIELNNVLWLESYDPIKR